MTENEVLIICVAIIVLCIIAMIVTGAGNNGGASFMIGG